MEFLLRKDAPFTPEQWEKIDETVVKIARQVLVGRRFISLYGPLGAGVQSINVDTFTATNCGQIDFFGEDECGPLAVRSRCFVEIPMVYKDLKIAWRDLEHSNQYGLPLDLSSLIGAAAICAKKEDELIFLGNPELGYEGLLTAAGVRRIAKGNWSEGESAFLDVAQGIELLVGQGLVSNFALVVSPDLYRQMQRVQPHTGLLESERVGKLVEGHLFQSAVLGTNSAVLVCSEAQNMDLVIGQDMITGYLGPDRLNHTLRVLETALLRIKRKDAIVVFG